MALAWLAVRPRPGAGLGAVAVVFGVLAALEPPLARSGHNVMSLDAADAATHLVTAALLLAVCLGTWRKTLDRVGPLRAASAHESRRDPCRAHITVLQWLEPLGAERTRFVQRLRAHLAPTPAGLLFDLVFDPGDFPMMRRQVLGIRQRAGRAHRSAANRRGEA